MNRYYSKYIPNERVGIKTLGKVIVNALQRHLKTVLVTYCKPSDPSYNKAVRFCPFSYFLEGEKHG